MKSTQRIALIGSNGKAGSVILAELLSNHFQVNALVREQRNITNISNDLLHVFIGDATEESVIAALIKDCDVLLILVVIEGI